MVLRTTSADNQATLEPITLPISSLAINGGLFPLFGGHETLIQISPPPTSVVGIDVLPGLDGDDGLQTFGFTAEKPERSFAYSSLSIFSAGFRWRRTGETQWNRHETPDEPLVITP